MQEIPFNIRNNFFFCYEGDQTLAQVAKEIVDSPSLKVLKTQLDTALRNLLCLTLIRAEGLE